LPRTLPRTGEQLTALGHEVRIVTAPWGDDPPAQDVIQIGQAIAIPYNGSIGRISLSLRLEWLVNRMLKREAFDVIHHHEPLVPFLSMQILDQLMMQGPLQRGQVPTGKSSALRTTGTTMALLQQGDVRADQLLLRWFNGVSQIYRIFHRMNRHFLPVGKEFRVVGWDGPDEQAYQKIDSIADVDVDMDFEFKPEFLNSNPDVLVAGLEKVLMMMMQPLAFQIGITDATLVHRTVQKITRAMRLDPKDHWKAPTMSVRPPISAEEAIAMAIAGQAIYGQPLEGAQAHLEKLGQYVMSEAVATLSAHPTSMGIFKAWWLEVAGMAQQEQLAQSSQGFADAQKSGTSGQPVAPTGGGEVPQIGTGDMAPPADAMATEVTGGAM